MLKSSLIDVQYCGVKNLSSIYLITAKDGEAALVDTGTPQFFPQIQKFLENRGIKRDQLTSVYLTHAHLDHSGNVSLFVKNYPNIKIYLNPLTAGVMLNPEKICRRMEATMNGRWNSEFGNYVQKIPEKYLVETKENTILKLGGYKTIKVINTPGHSKDHISFFDTDSKTLYSGDSFGTFYGTVVPKKSVFSCPPMFVPKDIPSTIEKVKKLGVKRFALSHFGFVDDAKAHIEQCERFAKRFLEIMKNPETAKSNLVAVYDESYFPKCTERYRRLRGHMEVNYQGMLSVFEPKNFGNYFKD